MQLVAMRGQCGIAVVAATLATGKGSSTSPRDAGVAPPHVRQTALRRKPSRVSPSVLEAAAAITFTRQRRGSPAADSGDGNQPLLRALLEGSSARQQASCADATAPCPQPLLPRISRTQARRVRKRGFVGPTDAAGRHRGRAARSRSAGSSAAGLRAAAAVDMHDEVLFMRGGGGGGTSWFGRSSDYDEFPPDFDYDDDEEEEEDSGTEDGGDDDSDAFCWTEEEEEPASAAAAAAAPPSQDEDSMISSTTNPGLKDFLEEEDAALMKEEEEQEGQGQGHGHGQGQEQGRRRSGRPDRKKTRSSSARFGQGGGGTERGSAASSPGLKRYVLVHFYVV